MSRSKYSLFTRKKKKIFKEQRTGDISPEIYTLDNSTTDNYTVEVSAWRSASLQARYRGHPKPSVVWYFNDNDEIDYINHRVLKFDGLTLLKIDVRALRHTHRLVYTLRASNDVKSTEKKFLLLVNGSCRYYSIDDTLTIACHRTTKNSRP